MNKQRLSTIGLIFITFLSAIQYVFLTHVPDTVPTFAFVGVTNLIGLVLMGIVLFKKIFTMKKKTLLKGMFLAFLLTGMNFFMVLGSKNTETVIVSSLLSLYFVFITPLLILLKKKVNLFSGIASIVAVIALLLMFGANTSDLFSSINVIFLIICDIFFAGYVVSISILGEDEDSSQLTLAQMLFAFVFSTIGWIIESFASHQALALPRDMGFWIGAVFIGIFIRALYGVIQMHSQKYVPALTASLIFSSEIIITLITNPIIYFLFGVEYTKATVYQIIGCFLFIIASLLLDDAIMQKFGYKGIEDKTYVNEKNETVRFQSITKKITIVVLNFTLITLVVSMVICLAAIQSIRNSAVENSSELGESAAKTSESALKKELEEHITLTVEDKAQLAEQKLSGYSDALVYAASYAGALYTAEGKYPDKELMAPDKKNAGKWTMQRGLANTSIDYGSLKEESKLLGNMEDVIASMATHKENIATIYLGTESGLMFSYDINSDNAGDGGEVYYEFRETDWYQRGKKAEKYVFTDTYYDNFGRGLTITCVAPFRGKNGKFLGCIAMDILVKDLNASMVNDGIVDPNVATLLDEDGGIIASKDIESTAEKTFSIYETDGLLKDYAKDILKEKNGLIQSGDGEGSSYIAYATIKSTNWTLCITSPVSEVIKPAKAIRAGIDENTENVVGATVKGVLTVVQNCLVLLATILLFATAVAGRFSRKISDPLTKLEEDVRKIGEDLDQRTDVSTDDEIGSLANSFNQMTDSLQKYICDLKDVTAKEERIASELSVATNIQASMVPTNFDEYSNRSDFDLYASMTPAKEVGGDFYDFFLIDEDHLALVMADVSGKGVPAALFMAKGKTAIKSRTLAGGTLSEILTDVNEQMCEGNEAELFVTVWLAIIDLKTGKGVAANAGHEHPALRRADGSFELIKYRHSPAVATMEGMRFREHEFELHSGDTLYVYTDGVTEATNAHNELFGEERLEAALNKNPDAEPQELLKNVKEDIDAFVADAPQFDDITMLAIKLS